MKFWNRFKRDRTVRRSTLFKNDEYAFLLREIDSLQERIESLEAYLAHQRQFFEKEEDETEQV
jgi:predicted  nucleic acid-binding Zn-ribbon protein